LRIVYYPKSFGPLAQLVRAEDLSTVDLKHKPWSTVNGLHVSKLALLACRTTQIRGSLCCKAW